MRALLAIIGLIVASAMILYDIEHASRWHDPAGFQRKTKSITDVDEFLSTFESR